jgi:hypothetical protein
MRKPGEGEPDSALVATRSQLAQFGMRFALPLPDAFLAAGYAMAAALPHLPLGVVSRIPPALMGLRQELAIALIIEGGLLLTVAALVDVATRLRKRPPVWAVPLIFGALLLMSNEARAILSMAYGRGAAVFIPLLVSLLERATILWTMPKRPEIEKIAVRAMTANRITTGLALLAIVTALMITGVALSEHFELLAGETAILGAGAIYFGVAAFDAWRVRTRRFAENPTVLFRFDPLGLKYLHPL